jgi:lysozyme
MTPDLLKHLKHEEGFVGHVYKCPAGYDTIGYGHRTDGTPHPPITEAQAEALLIADEARFEAMALRLSPGLKDEPARRLDAITDFCFNLGGGNYGGSVLRLRVNEKKWAEAGVQMRRWVYATDPKTGKKRILAALVDRREVTARWLEATDDLPHAA